jgi:hypothetical protein
LTSTWLKRGTHRSVAELQQSIQAWIDTWNQDPRPLVWTRTADEILDTIRQLQPTQQRLRTLDTCFRDQAVSNAQQLADLLISADMPVVAPGAWSIAFGSVRVAMKRGYQRQRVGATSIGNGPASGVLGLFTSFSSGAYMSVRSNPSFGREMSTLSIVFQLRRLRHGSVTFLPPQTSDRRPLTGYRRS